MYEHLLKTRYIQTMSELANILAFLKSLLEQLNCDTNNSFTCPIELAASCLESYHLSNVVIEDESNSWLPLSSISNS